MHASINKRRSFAILGLVIAYHSVSFVRAGEQPSMEKILATWKQRQDNTRSFDFQWEERHTYARHSMPVFKGEPAPATDVTTVGRASLQVEGDRMRLWSNAPTWDRQTKRFVPREHVSVFDGKDEKLFYDQVEPGVEAEVPHKVGTIGITPYNMDVVDPHVWPLLLMYRPRHPHMGRFKPGQWRIATEQAVAHGRNCLILQAKAGAITEKCWVDYERQCIIVRYEYITTFRAQLDIWYNEVSKERFVPARWKLIDYLPKGTVRETCDARVTDYAINPSFSRSLFQCDFPIGTEVTDWKAKTSYIVRKGGEKRYITEEERKRGATYEQMVATESGEAGLPRKGHRTFRAAAIIGLAALGLLAVVLWRKWQRAAGGRGLV